MPGALHARRLRIPRWLAFLVGILGLLVLFGMAWIAKEGLTNQVWPVDVLVVFGNRIDPGGVPSPWLKARLDRAVELYREGVSTQFIVSGGMGKEGFDEARMMQAYLVRQGIPDTNIWLDDHGDNTLLTAQHAAERMRQQGWSSAILVSQFYHLPRARLAFQQAGVDPVGSAAANGFFTGDLPGLLREVFAYPAYWLSGRQ